MNEGDTPLTDASVIHCLDILLRESVDADFARDLERKLAEARNVLLAIEERFTDGEDTFDDWRFMGTTAREALARIDAGNAEGMAAGADGPPMPDKEKP